MVHCFGLVLPHRTELMNHKYIELHLDMLGTWGGGAGEGDGRLLFKYDGVLFGNFRKTP